MKPVRLYSLTFLSIHLYSKYSVYSTHFYTPDFMLSKSALLQTIQTKKFISSNLCFNHEFTSHTPHHFLSTSVYHALLYTFHHTQPCSPPKHSRSHLVACRGPSAYRTADSTTFPILIAPTTTSAGAFPSPTNNHLHFPPPTSTVQTISATKKCAKIFFRKDPVSFFFQHFFIVFICFIFQFLWSNVIIFKALIFLADHTFQLSPHHISTYPSPHHHHHHTTGRSSRKTRRSETVMALLPIEREDWPGPPEPAAAYPELCGWPCCSFLALYQIILHYITSYFIIKKTTPISLILLFPGSAPTRLDAKNSSKWATFFCHYH